MKIDRALRFGGYGTLVVIAVLAIVAGVNLLVERLPWRADLTIEKFYSLSEQTLKVLATVDRPITVLELWEAGKEDEKVAELLRRYQTQSAEISVRQVDPYRNPVELKRYTVGGEAPAVGSLVVDAGGRFKVLRTADLYETREDPTTGEQVATGFIAESALTNAIASATAGADPVLYLLKGHGEKELQDALADRLRRAFYDVRDLTLAAAATARVPDDAAIVALVSPLNDILPGEAAELTAFLRERGGKLLLLTDVGATPHPNIGRLLEAFGLAVRPWLVVERASDHFLPNQPWMLIPSVGSHAITAPNAAAEMPILFPISQAIERLPAVRRTVRIEPLLASSSQSYAKVDIQDESGEQGPNDPSGPFVLAAAVTDTGEVGQVASRMVVMASSQFIFPSANLGRLAENENLFMNTLGWLLDRPELISIPARTISGNRYELNLSQFQFFLFAGIAVVLIPFAVFIAGLATWLRRRHR